MNEIYEIAISACDYSTAQHARSYKLNRGDCFIIQSDEQVKIGDRYKSYPSKIYKIYYASKKWWQFWKKKKQIGFAVMWMGIES